MIVVRLPRSSSFERRIAYLYRHGHAMFTARQCLMSPATAAAVEMDATWSNQARLKETTGLPRGGRRCENPVCHDVISWDEDEWPSFDEMERAARSYLAAIGLAEHQALMVGHDHNGKRHVHIVVNAVHPITGRVADRTNDQLKAQAWALAYEVAQGRVRCRHRTAPKIDRAFARATTGKRQSGQRLSRAEFEKKRNRTAADEEARKLHKAEAWKRLMTEQSFAASNGDPVTNKRRTIIPALLQTSPP